MRMLISAIVALILLPPVATAGMDVMEDCELAVVNAKGGISTMISDFMLTGANEIIIFDSDPATAPPTQGEIRFVNLAIYRFTPTWVRVPFSIGSVADPIKMDVGTDTLGRSILSYRFPVTDLDPFTFSSDQSHFSGENLGYTGFVHIDPRGSHIYLASRAGDEGIDLGLGLQLNIGHLVCVYHSSAPLRRHTWNGVHLSRTAAGSIIDPATWTFSGPFYLGRLFNDAGAPVAGRSQRIDVQDGRINLLIEGVAGAYSGGSVRIESVAIDGTSFGHSVLDGIRAYYFRVQIPGP